MDSLISFTYQLNPGFFFLWLNKTTPLIPTFVPDPSTPSQWQLTRARLGLVRRLAVAIGTVVWGVCQVSNRVLLKALLASK